MKYSINLCLILLINLNLYLRFLVSDRKDFVFGLTSTYVTYIQVVLYLSMKPIFKHVV